MPKRSIAQKRGFGLGDAMWGGFGVVLINAPIDIVSSMLCELVIAKVVSIDFLKLCCT
jgi:hypothetical protein